MVKENRKIIDKIFKYSKGLDTHVIFYTSFENLTRFGDNEISQNVSTTDMYAQIRIIDGSKIYKFLLSSFDDNSIKTSFENAKAKLKFMKKYEFVPYPTKTSVKINSDRFYDEKISCLTPQDRARKIKPVIDFCKKKGYLSYGILSNSINDVVVANNNGLYQRAISTSIEYEITINSKGGYGKASAYSYKDDIDFDKTNERAIDKAEMSKNSVLIKPGKYTVILEPLAVGSFFGFFGYLGFNALSYYEQRSFASGNIGKKIFSDKLTIIEDPFNISYPVLPFDLEGMPREKVVLVENGVLKNVVTDKKTSKITGFRYTGHSLFEPNSYGAIPCAMAIEAGKKKLDEIIKETDNAILVTEFHYTNPLKAKTLEITGMTRNGTYIINNGKITRAIKNMRFTQNMVEAFNNIVDIGMERAVVSQWAGAMLVPSMKINNFNFSSQTEF